MPEKLYKPSEVAEMLKVKTHTVQMWLWRGKLKGVRVGRMWRISEKDIEEFIKTSMSRDYRRKKKEG